MAYDANVLRRATERLDRERRERQERTERLRALAYSRQPALEKLDRELQGTMAQLVAAALRQGEDPAQAVRQVRDRNLALQRERAGLLAGLGSRSPARTAAAVCSPFSCQRRRMPFI